MGDVVDFGMMKVLNEIDNWDEEFVKMLELLTPLIASGNDQMHILQIFKVIYLNLKWLQGSVAVINSSEALKDLIANKGGKEFILAWLDEIRGEIQNIECKS